MQNKRIWTALAAGVVLGLILALVGIGGWWILSNEDRALVLARQPDELEKLIGSAPAITLNDAPREVTIISPRAARGLDYWLGEGFDELSLQGRGVRVVMVPSDREDTVEEATVAELWLGRSTGLLAQWMDMPADLWTAVGIAPVTQSRERMAAVAEAHAFRRAVKSLSGSKAGDKRWPMVVWRDGAGQLAVCYCNTPKALEAARHALRLGYQEVPALAEEAVPYQTYERPRDEPEEEDRYGDYPRLTAPEEGYDDDWYSSENPNVLSESHITPSPLLPGDVVRPETTPAPIPSQTEVKPKAQQPSPAPARRPREGLTTTPPKAEKDADSLFY